ncbi:SCO family protein [Longibacter salinarum]|uniref:SCO family protein n=1 Tax=Longibacter salinarum TaxID=1850348 RepID=UPI0015CF635F|nr:SCO family protein [Longibacter salinarum]
MSALLILALLTACSSDDLPVYEDLSETTFELVDQDSTRVEFPQAYRGDILIVGAIYTQCPDVCPLITGKMDEIRRQLENRSDVRFVTVTFDPRRDTPSRLASYRSAFGIDGPRWPFLTGTPKTIDSLMSRLNIKSEIASGDTTGTYFIDHTDQITLIDDSGRVRYRYHGSGTPPALILEDINKLRS